VTAARGAPGVRWAPSRPAGPALRPERLDVAGFVGVASRGPVDTPVVVASWAEFAWRFGGDGSGDSTVGPGRLAAAVHAFLAQGGVRAEVLRVSPLPRAPAAGASAAVASHRLPLGRRALDLLARDEGAWGAGLTVTCAFVAAATFPAIVEAGALLVPPGVVVIPGSLLRLRRAGLPAAGVLAWVRDTSAVREPGRPVTVRLGGSPPPDGEVDVAVVTATVDVVDSAADLPRAERFEGLGLSPAHPRWAARVLRDDSRLVIPGAGWDEPVLPSSALLPPATSVLVRGGLDRWSGIGAGSFFDADVPVGLLPADPPQTAADRTVHGLDRLALSGEIGMLCAPDLLWAWSTPGTQTVPAAPRPAGFARCAPPEPPTPMTTEESAALLDGTTELGEIVRRQGRLVELAERQRRWVALLDVPPRLPLRAIARWRSHFESSYAAAYHPWLRVPAPRGATRSVPDVPPSAFAAGVLADREIRDGLPWGPANELARGVVDAVDPVPDEDVDALADLGIDVFRAERDGFRLTTARTLSADPDYRQLSVRRLMTMLALVLRHQTQWLVFEPNTVELRASLVAALTALLRGLYEAGAFAGATEADSFFVQCDDALNPGSSTALGRLVAEIGVCPSSPLEYLLLRVRQDADGAVAVEG
jgi:uncharacterized protein